MGYSDNTYANTMCSTCRSRENGHNQENLKEIDVCDYDFVGRLHNCSKDPCPALLLSGVYICSEIRRIDSPLRYRSREEYIRRNAVSRKRRVYSKETQLLELERRPSIQLCPLHAFLTFGKEWRPINVLLLPADLFQKLISVVWSARQPPVPLQWSPSQSDKPLLYTVSLLPWKIFLIQSITHCR